MYVVVNENKGRYSWAVVAPDGSTFKRYRYEIKINAEKKAKELNKMFEYEAQYKIDYCDSVCNPPIPVCTLPCTPCAPCTPSYPAGCRPKTEEKESTMNYGYETANLETQQRNHLKRRLDDAFHTFKTALKMKFNIYVDATPKTLDELKRKLAASEIKIDTTQFNADGKYNGWAGVLSTIKFIDPTKVEDEAGYKAARKDLETKLQAAKDIALVAPLADGLKALQDFEATAV